MRSTSTTLPSNIPAAERPVVGRGRSLAAALGGLIALGAALPALAEGASGQTIGLTCVVCHGEQGRGTKTIPPLAGRSADQIYAALIAYKTGARPSSVMDRHAKGYSDDELRAVAEYFAAQPAK